MTDKTGGPAFPRPAVFTETLGLASVELDGMTLRDYFAAKAMQAAIAYGGFILSDDSFNRITKGSYGIADAMLKARDN